MNILFAFKWNVELHSNEKQNFKNWLMGSSEKLIQKQKFVIV